MEEPTIINLDQWVREWSLIREPNLNKKIYRADYDWSGVQFIWETPCYESHSPTPIRSSSQIFKDTVSNDTDLSLTHHFEAVKKTHSRCQVALFSAIKRDGQVDTTLHAPQPLVEAGFPSVVEIRSKTHSDFNEDIEIHINSYATVEKGQKVTLTVTSVERMFASIFTLRVRIRGKIIIRIYKDNQFYSRHEGDFRAISDALISNGSELVKKEEELVRGSNDITMTVKGRCHFQYVVDQDTNLSYFKKPQPEG